MASTSQPRILTYKAGGVIVKGHAIKFGADREHVVECTAVTDKSIGVAQGAATAAEELVEVAINGGGAKGLAQAAIAFGDKLTSHTDGTLKPVSAGTDRCVGVAMESAVAGDIFAMEIALS